MAQILFHQELAIISERDTDRLQISQLHMRCGNSALMSKVKKEKRIDRNEDCTPVYK